MQAVILESFGPAHNLRLGTTADPQAEDGWVVVQLKAAALNWHDVYVRKGLYHSPLPHVIGADGAGVVAGTGQEVIILPSLWWGDEQSAPSPRFQILGDTQRGTYAELVRVPAACVAPKPPTLSWREAAALPLVGVTVFRALISRGRLRAGERLLVLGAGGGVATMAVAMARAVGAEAVVTSSSTDKIEHAQSLGAFGGVLYSEPDWTDSAKALSRGGQGFDLVLDSVGLWEESLATLRPGGRLVVLGSSRRETANLGVRQFFFGQYDLLGTAMGSNADFRGLLDLVTSGQLPPPPIDRAFPLEAAADAHAYIESGSQFGKVVLDIS